MATEPQFIERNVDAIVADMIAYYENATGKTLQPAQPERLLINTFAYREGLVRQAIQDASVQNLVSFSTAPVLDYLGELVGVKRLAAAPASCTLRFTITNGPTGQTMPAGIRVASNDGQVVFATLEGVSIAPNQTTPVDIVAQCITPGALGNGYLANSIKTILDPLGYVTAATNLATTAGGADQESDAALRERIKLAPASFSNAGSVGAYKFHARSASSSIIDVAITSPTPGTVNIYPLVAGGVTTPTPVLNAVSAACNSDNVRPLTDTVVVASPTFVTYPVDVEIEIYAGQDSAAIQAAVEDALQAFADMRLGQLGKDVTESQVLAIAHVPGVYRAVLAQAIGTSGVLAITATQVAKLTGGVIVTVTGTVNG
jgi:phage-related baseplate assembly protein